MALDFLGALGGATQAVGAIGSLASSLGGLFGKQQKVPQQATDALNLQSSLMRGLSGGNSPEFNNMMQAERDRSREALIKAVNEIVRQNRRGMTRGPVSVLSNPDRRDEAIARALMGIYENEGDKARAAAKQTALGMLGQAGGVAQGNIAASNLNYMGARNAAADRALGFSTIGQFGSRGVQDLSSLFSGLGAGAPSTTINDPMAQQKKAISGGIY